MCHSLYVEANGDLPCWDDVGEDLILGQLDVDRLRSGTQGPILGSPPMIDLRSSFLAGELPHPELCQRCAVLGHGAVSSVELRRLEVLHVEPSFLCHLACPQCVPPEQRRAVRSPPYTMPPELLDLLLGQLRAEGIEHVRVAHFEGRGDPLMHPHLGELLRLSKAHYPGTFTQVTTHGNFALREWMLDGDLDLLRICVDGAREESYRRYRVGGRLERPLGLMQALRDRRRQRGSRLRVEWKYILFEFNDSDDELLEAASLAEKLDVELCFCLTHSQLRSRRFADLDEVNSALQALGVHARETTTFQLKRRGSAANAGEVIAEHVEHLLLASLSLLRSGDSDRAVDRVSEALALDPGIEIDSPEAGDRGLVGDLLERILLEASSPSTLSALANIAMERHEWRAAERLLRAYLDRSPRAADRATVEVMHAALVAGCELRESGWDRRLLAIAHPAILSDLAGTAMERGEWMAAEKLLTAYLERAPDAPDRDSVERTLVAVVVGNRLGCAVHEAWGVDRERIAAAEAAVLEVDPGEGTRGSLSGAAPLRLAERCRHPHSRATLVYLRWMLGDLRTARAILDGCDGRGELSGLDLPWTEELDLLRRGSDHPRRPAGHFALSSATRWLKGMLKESRSLTHARPR